MAKTPKNRSAMSTPSSLTSLLSVPSTPLPSVSPLEDSIILNQLNHGSYYDDRRRYHPQQHYKPPQGLIRSAVRLVNGKGKATVRFALPDLVGICVRRKTRRQVLHAINRINIGKGGGRRRRRNHHSGVQC